MKKFNQKKLKGILFTIICCIILITIIVNNYEGKKVEETKDSNTITANMSSSKERANEFMYLSDIEYIESQSKSGWGELLKDKTTNNTQISVKVNGVVNTFAKGMWAHASSVLMYDLNGLDYDYFTSLIGLNTTSRAGNGVTFRIYTSVDGTNFELQKETVKLPQENAEFIKIDIKGKRYLKLEAYDNRGNGQDHSVYADAKLTKESYEASLEAINLAAYNEKIKNYGEVNLNNAEQELTVLQRDLIKNAGEFSIKRFIGESNENKVAFEWLFNNLENLRLYTMGGKPTGSYYNSFQVLRRLLEAHQSDFDNNEVTQYGTRYGDLYKRMAITLSLTHSAQVALWMQPGAPENQSDAVTRYEIYKDLHKNNKFKAREDIDITKWFESYNIEEMRFVMNNLIDDESIVWLNEYVQSKIDAAPNSAWGLLTPHPYMAYVWPNYGNPVYYAEENYDYFNELFSVNGKKLYDYGITRGTSDKKVYKVWMNFRNKFGTGAVCGGISKSGSNIRATHGIPVAVIGQPGHAAIIYYTQDAQGNGFWNLDNDVSGWAYSEKGERMLLGWGNESYQRGYSVVYMALAQEVLNNFETFEASQKKVLLADVYEEDLAKRERIYREALQIQPYNINAWYGLILTYNANSNKTEDEYYELAKEIGENLKYFPLPMLHLTNLIKPRLTSIENDYKFTLLQTRILTAGTQVPNNSADNYSVYQPALTRLEANHLLGNLDKNIASFSFDGEDAGKIVLSSKYDSNGVRWDYSLDGGNNWKEVAFTAEEEHKLQLSEAEIASITEENDIKVHIVGVNYEPENIFVIDITKAQTPTTLFGNDLENRVIGINLTYEWRRNEEESWTSYREASPDNTGNKKLQVRVGANGTSLPSEVLEFEFTEDNQPNTRKYVSISHLSIHEYSTAATGQGRYATNAIDGNYNTNWHSAWNGSDTERFITIKLDKPRYISAIEYVPAGGGNGKMLDGTIFGSTDGENWEVLYTAKNLTYTNQANTNADAIKNTKSFEIENPKEVEYIKIVADRASNGNWFTARAFNFFQDLTKNPRPTAGVGYSTTSATNQSVVARLINPSTNITITNNGGSDTYTFTKNGEFTFEFVDEFGTVGTSTAKVDWIDRVVPTATFEYSITEKTNEDVIVRLIPSEEVTVLNNGEVSVENPTVDPFTYTFLENGEFTFEFKDKAGNIGSATAKVDWIDNDIPEATINYSTLDLTNKDVTVQIEFNKENVKITNNNGSNTYTFKENGEFIFEFVDEAGNFNTASAIVTWINKKLPTVTVTYSTTEVTNGPVSATIHCDENITITNNNGQSIYTFTENGTFTFEFTDKLGNKGTITARVDWIKKEEPTEPEKPVDPVTPIVPTNPTNPNKPGNSNKNNNNQNNQPNNSNNNIVDNKPSVDPVLKDFLAKDVLVTVDSNKLEENSVLKKNFLSLTQSQIKRFGNDSEVFELYFENSSLKNHLENEEVKMFINLNKNKTFLGIYKVDGENVELLSYELVSDNQIKVDTTGLSKYIIAYDKKVEEETTLPVINNKNETTTPKANSSIIWVIIGSGGVAAILCIAIILLLKNSRKEEQYQMAYAE